MIRLPSIEFFRRLGRRDEPSFVVELALVTYYDHIGLDDGGYFIIFFFTFRQTDVERGDVNPANCIIPEMIKLSQQGTENLFLSSGWGRGHRSRHW